MKIKKTEICNIEMEVSPFNYVRINDKTYSGKVTDRRTEHGIYKATWVGEKFLVPEKLAERLSSTAGENRPVAKIVRSVLPEKDKTKTKA